MNELAYLYMDLLIWDIQVFSQTWLYYWIFPAPAFLAFFLLKWSALTAPVWLPLAIVISASAIKQGKS